MSALELANLFHEAYMRAPQRDKSLHVTLFGIRYAAELEQFVSQDICELADVGKWGPQLNLAKKLARYVSIDP